jgi:hypothetical protein
VPIIIFGIRRKQYRLATVFAVCSVCHSPAAQAVVRVRAFFTLFFLPVIPLGHTYRTTCTMCGRSVKVAKESAEHLVATAQIADPVLAQQHPWGPHQASDVPEEPWAPDDAKWDQLA